MNKYLSADARLLPPLATKALHIFLHKKHADLVPAVVRALANMKKGGTYQRIFDRKLSVLIE